MAETLNPIYKKIPGGIFGILVTISGNIALSIAAALFYTVEPFTFFTHWVSNLGGAVTNSGFPPNSSNIVFTIGLVILAVFAAIFVVYLVKILLSGDQNHGWLVICMIATGVTTLIGLLTVAFFDMKSQPVIHTYGGVVFFISATLMILFFSLSIFSNSEFPRLLGLFSLIIAAIQLVFLLTFIPHLLAGEDLVSIVISTAPEMGLTRFCEWIFIIALFTWFAVTGAYSLKKKW